VRNGGEHGIRDGASTPHGLVFVRLIELEARVLGARDYPAPTQIKTHRERFEDLIAFSKADENDYVTSVFFKVLVKPPPLLLAFVPQRTYVPTE
jgi:hypothetical protein